MIRIILSAILLLILPVQVWGEGVKVMKCQFNDSIEIQSWLVDTKNKKFYERREGVWKEAGNSCEIIKNNYASKNVTITEDVLNVSKYAYYSYCEGTYDLKSTSGEKYGEETIKYLISVDFETLQYEKILSRTRVPYQCKLLDHLNFSPTE